MLLVWLLSYLLLLQSSWVRSQVSFGDYSDSSNNDWEQQNNNENNQNFGNSDNQNFGNSDNQNFDNSDWQQQGNQDGIGFGDSSSNNQNGVSLKDVLSDHVDAPDVDTRAGGLFGGSSQRYGQSCVTPTGSGGACAYIFDSPCQPVLNAILQQGLSQQLLGYLIQAIRSPCGFEGFDFTLCCATQNVNPPPPPPTTAPITQNEPCGISESNRIVGGELASPGAWPWAVILGQPGFGGTFQVICGGTLLNRNTVLTASHCFEGSGNPTFVRVGDTDITSTADGVGQDIRIASVNKHPGWNSASLSDDICILKLSQPVQYSRSARWACLPTQYQGLVLSDVLQNPSPSIIGWGSTRKGGGSETRLRQAKVPMVTQSVCANNYKNVGKVVIGDTKLCAGNGQVDTCNGDSGGALLANNIGGSWSVVGITSFGVDCAREGYPGVYTRVDKYLPWINGFL